MKNNPPLPERKRRYVQRDYSFTTIRKIFNIPANEMIIDLKYNKDLNRYELTTLLDYKEKEGDI